MFALYDPESRNYVGFYDRLSDALVIAQRIRRRDPAHFPTVALEIDDQPIAQGERLAALIDEMDGFRAPNVEVGGATFAWSVIGTV